MNELGLEASNQESTKLVKTRIARNSKRNKESSSPCRIANTVPLIVACYEAGLPSGMVVQTDVISSIKFLAPLQRYTAL